MVWRRYGGEECRKKIEYLWVYLINKHKWVWKIHPKSSTGDARILNEVVHTTGQINWSLYYHKLAVIRVPAPFESLKSMTFPWWNKEIPWPCARKGPVLHFSQYYWEYYIYVGSNCLFFFYGIFPFSMTFPWFLTFSKISITSPGLKISHSNSMTFPGFPWPHEPRVCQYELASCS